MWPRVLSRAARSPQIERRAGPNAFRDRLAVLFALVTGICLAAILVLAKDTKLLMPGPLTSAHGAIESCSTCHTSSGSNNVSWLQGLAPGDRLADSKACLACHTMPDTAFNPHGASTQSLKKSTERLTKIAATTPAPLSARAQSAAFPTHAKSSGGITCASCHQEHQGAGFNLSKISNEQCRSCHVVKFDSFDGDHPKFESYPFERRTRIIYDHAAHFGKHFPEIAKKEPTKRIPETCASCHNSRGDKRDMAVAPFEQTCASCHLDQITGKERASGPKGIAFLSLPGLDMQTLRKKNAAIGEWPAESEAQLTPFMKAMISRTERGRAVIKTVDGLNLQELGKANDRQIRAVTSLVWEIKGIFHALISGKASDVLADLGIGGGAKLSAGLVTELTAHLPRDVLVGAQQQWLPSLGAEMAARPQARQEKAQEAKPQETGGWITTTTESKATQDSGTGTVPEPGTPAQTRHQAGAGQRLQIAQAAGDAPRAKAADQTDDLLNLTDEELRAVAAPVRDLLKAGQPKGAAGPAAAAAQPEAAPPAGETPPATAAAATPPPAGRPPEISIKSDIDPENWAEYGGWYRQDYAIFYRPDGHKDKFIYSWLFLTGPQAPKGSKAPAAAVFDVLRGKDAQGACTKCHSVDDIGSKGRVVNFSRASAERRQGRFTQFIHEPHFGIMESQGCLTCHSLEKGREYLKSYEQGNPHKFESGFGGVKKELCQTCHTANLARQDCLTCHKYHVNGVLTPIMSTKIPTE